MWLPLKAETIDSAAMKRASRCTGLSRKLITHRLYRAKAHGEDDVVLHVHLAPVSVKKQVARDATIM